MCLLELHCLASVVLDAAAAVGHVVNWLHCSLLQALQGGVLARAVLDVKLLSMKMHIVCSVPCGPAVVAAEFISHTC